MLQWLTEAAFCIPVTRRRGGHDLKWAAGDGRPATAANRIAAAHPGRQGAATQVPQATGTSVTFCVHTVETDIFVLLVLRKCYYLGSGVAKSIVRVVRVVHLLLRTSNLFQLTCPCTSKKNLIPRCLKKTILFPKDAANTDTRRY